MVKLYLMLIYIIVLSGCVGDQRNVQNVPQTSAPPVVNMAPSQPAVSRDDLERLRSETVASSNANQQSQTGALNLAMGKMAEEMNGVRGDLSGVKADLKISNSATAELHATMSNKADVTALAQLRAELKAEIQAELNAQMNAQGAAVAALKSTVDNQAQTISAGRDSNTSTIQFSKEFQQTLEASYKAMVSELKQALYCIAAVCHIWAGVIIALLHGSVKHERKRSDALTGHAIHVISGAKQNG